MSFFCPSAGKNQLSGRFPAPSTAFIYFLLLINNFIFQDVTAQIVGGEDATIEELPYIVSLRINNQHFCGGSIISTRHILTAAHCLFRRQELMHEMTVVTGSTLSYGNYGEDFGVMHMLLHPRFTYRPADKYRFDIAVMTLRGSIRFSASSQKINLPVRDTTSLTSAMISGWGYTNLQHQQISPTLKRALTTTIPNPACSQRLRAANLAAVGPGQLCAFQRIGVGTCGQDSGGPLTARHEIIGIISYGVPCALGHPDVFTRVFAYKSWIEEYMAAHP